MQIDRNELQGRILFVGAGTKRQALILRGVVMKQRDNLLNADDVCSILVQLLAEQLLQVNRWIPERKRFEGTKGGFILTVRLWQPRVTMTQLCTNGRGRNMSN